MAGEAAFISWSLSHTYLPMRFLGSFNKLACRLYASSSSIIPLIYIYILKTSHPNFYNFTMTSNMQRAYSSLNDLKRIAPLHLSL